MTVPTKGANQLKDINLLVVLHHLVHLPIRPDGDVGAVPYVGLINLVIFGSFTRGLGDEGIAL